MQTAPTSVRTERDEKHPLAVVLGQGTMAHTLISLLKIVHLRTILLEDSLDKWHALETPHYFYLLVSPGDNIELLAKLWQGALPLAKRSRAKIIFICAGLSSAEEKTFATLEGGKVDLLTLVLAGDAEAVKKSPEAFLKDCIAQSFSESSVARKVIIGRGIRGDGRQGGQHQVKKWEEFLRSQGLRSTKSVFDALDEGQILAHKDHKRLKERLWAKRRFAFGLRAIILLTVFFLVLPFLVVGLAYGGGVNYLLQSRVSLGRGDFLLASQQASEAQKTFERGKFVTRTISETLPLGQAVFSQVLEVGEAGSGVAEIVKRGAIMQKNVVSLTQDIFSGEKKPDLPERVATLHPELLALDQKLGLVQTMLKSEQMQNAVQALSWFGFPAKTLENAPTEIATARELIIVGDRVLTVLPELLAISPRSATKRPPQIRTYLLVFQNSAELRPTGGFIGSFGVVTMEEGIMKDLVFHDVYSADGQLQGRVIPPDEIVHYLGQNSWFLRDANFSPDFPLTAKRLEFFLEKETGQRVDGVIGIDLQAVQYLLKATGPLKLSDFPEVVTAENFFQKAEFVSEIGFFPGSTQKKDFLGSVGQTLLQTALTKERGNVALAQAIERSLREQHILLFFNNRTAQERIEANGWSGSITRQSCGTAISHCLMIVEANFGANKANYFIKRAVRIQSQINERGEIETKVVLHLRNDSPSLAWPGGNYKNYLRFLLPKKAKLVGLDIDNKKTASISSTLNVNVLSKLTSDQFLVYTSPEASGALMLSTTEAFKSVGALVEVPFQSDREITLRYVWNQPLSTRQTRVPFRFTILKQSGTNADPLDVAIEYPQSWQKTSSGGKVVSETGILGGTLVFPHRVLYNTDLATDRVFEIEFQRSLR